MILRLIDKNKHYLPASEVDTSFTTKGQAKQAALKILKMRSDISRVELWETDSITDPDKKLATWGQRDVDKEPLGINSLLKDLGLTQPELAKLLQTTDRSLRRCKKGENCPAWLPVTVTKARGRYRRLTSCIRASK